MFQKVDLVSELRAKNSRMNANTHPSAAEYLSEELRKRIANNPRYSLRAFAQMLKVSPGELSELLRGKRNLTFKGALKISKNLGHAPEESQYWLDLILAEEMKRTGTSPNSAPLKRLPLTLDLFHLVSDWYCFGIVNLAETVGFKFETRSIARRLGISPAEAKLALERLERVGIIERVEGKLRITPDFVMSPEGIPSEAVRKFHGQILDLAKDALEKQSVDEREVSGISFAVDPRRIPELKKEIQLLLDAWAERLSKLDPHTRTEVYHFETLLFRLTQPEGKSV